MQNNMGSRVTVKNEQTEKSKLSQVFVWTFSAYVVSCASLLCCLVDYTMKAADWQWL